MILLAALLPGLTIILVTVIAALPWGLAGNLKLVLPLVPYVAIHIWVEREPQRTPDWLVFLAGFATDVTGQGPLGYWTFIYLCGYAAVRAVTAGRQLGTARSIMVFAGTVSLLVLMQWLVASLYYLRAVEIAPLIAAAAIATLFHSGLTGLFPHHAVERIRPNQRLERRA